MLPATSKAGGKCAGAPDTCKTPSPGGPVPTPYPKVQIEKKETVVESSALKNSKGDEAGTLKGVVSQTHRKDVKFKKYSSKVYAQNKKIVHHTAATTHNGTNPNLPVGAHVSPSQTKVMVAT